MIKPRDGVFDIINFEYKDGIMIKKLLLCVCVVSLVGCVYEGRKLSDYIENPRSFIRDPHFADYKEKRDAVESQYLSKEITYAQYVEQMRVLDDQYTKEINERNEKLSN